jgi:hypothetical protein
MIQQHLDGTDRKVLRCTAAILAWAAAAVTVAAAARDPDLIRRENQKPGAVDWQLTYVRLDKPNGYRSPGIEGYCSHQSVSAGEKIDFFVSTDPPARFTLDIFRMGYYGGKGARLMKTLGPFSGKAQPLPPVGPRRLRECRW